MNIGKWITWVLPSKDINEKTDKEISEIRSQLDHDVSLALEDIKRGVPISFKVTNRQRRSYDE